MTSAAGDTSLWPVIRSFRSKALHRYVTNGDRSRLSVVNLARLDRQLTALAAALAPEDLNLPGWRFHALKGDKAGRYAISVSGNWRLTFGWDGADATDVDLEDYN